MIEQIERKNYIRRSFAPGIPSWRKKCRLFKGLEYMDYDVGVDIGSVSINCVILDENQKVVLETPYLRHFGLIYEETHKLLSGILRRIEVENSGALRSVTFTGVHGELLAERLRAPSEVETIAQVLGAIHVVPGVRTIITVGGQDAAVFQLAHSGDEWRLESFNMNGPCASGTGSFIDQQAERLALSIYGPDFSMDQEKLQQTLDDFIKLGLESTYPAPVACRCTVFTKSDMIHLQNKGESLPNIIAGLHFGNAANYMSTIIGNREISDPIIFIGGMASNRLQVKAFKHYFPSLIVPAHHTSIGALGAALQARKQNWRNEVDLSVLIRKDSKSAYSFPRAERLELSLSSFDSQNNLAPWARKKGKPVEAYLGVDIGSTTTKYALISENARILHKCYVPTQGKPIEVTQRLLRTLQEEVGQKIKLMAIATTGSGRNVVGDFLGADLIVDEITAHARGAVEIEPDVDTIFEIGGQDSKYIMIENTHPLDFDMNKVCAAGTGSFLHELANKMKINIVGEFQEIALSSKNPIHLAERCTVFMESDLVSYLQKGGERRDLDRRALLRNRPQLPEPGGGKAIHRQAGHVPGWAFTEQGNRCGVREGAQARGAGPKTPRSDGGVRGRLVGNGTFQKTGNGIPQARSRSACFDEGELYREHLPCGQEVP